MREEFKASLTAMLTVFISVKSRFSFKLCFVLFYFCAFESLPSLKKFKKNPKYSCVNRLTRFEEKQKEEEGKWLLVEADELLINMTLCSSASLLLLMFMFMFSDCLETMCK